MAPRLLNKMANFNEKTIGKLNLNINRKYNMGEQSQIQFVEWNHNANFIACGGANGTLKVVRHGYDPTDNKLLAGNTLTVNQSLEGHQKMVLHASWNENYQKLTTSDVGGMITVWGGTNEQWHEEMINNRDKSSVVGLEWSPDGQLIAITYADGLVIVGTHDGNRVWSREMEVDLVTCAFSPFDQMIFGTTDGKVFAVDKEGNHVLDLYLPCLETVDLEQALARSRDHREEIVFMSYWSPVPKSKVRMEQEANLRAREAEKKSHAEPVKGTSIFHNYPKRQMREIPEMEKAGEPNQPVPADRPRFVVAYSRGVFQLMRNISDTDSIVIRLKLKITGGKWSPNGAFLAICGTDLEKGGSKVSIVYLLSAYGQTHGIYRHPDASFTGISWDSSGFRMAISSESNLLIATVRPEFKWGCIENTIIYVFQREEMFLYALMYYDYKTEERKEMGLRYFENIAFYKSHCVVVKRHEESTIVPPDDFNQIQTEYVERTIILTGKFTCELHNCIGTSLGFTLTAIRPKYVCVNETCAVVANESHYFIWHFVLPKLSAPVMNDEAQSAEYSLEEQQRTVEYGTRRLISSRDQICAICIGDTFFFIALRNGGIYRVNLADGVITNKFPVTPLVESMKLNCDNTRLAVVKLDQNQVPSSLTIYDLMGEVLQQKYTCDKKEIWGYTWDEHDPNMLAFKNKQTIVIYDGAGLVDQQNVSGEICSFNNLAVRTVNMNSILLSPTNPPKSAVQEMMIKAKYDLNSMLKASKLKEAIEYTEKNPHAELWKMIANWAVMNQKFDSAEHVFVKLQDYAGIQFVRQIQNITHRELQHAEILAFTEQLDEAKESFVACDRKDLAIEMYKKISEYEPIYKLIKDDKDENVKAEVLREIAEGHYENLDWEEAMKYYQQCGDTEMQIDCMIKAEKFGNLEELSRILPPDSVHLDRLADLFAAFGYCQQAVDCYLKRNQPQKALDVCIEQSQWDLAHSIANGNHLKIVDVFMEKYVEDMQGVSDDKSVGLLGLYMRARKFLDAAKIAFEIANDRREKMKPVADLKKCYVLAAILVEMYRSSSKNAHQITTHPEDVLDDEFGLSMDQIRILETTWRGAEAFHFMMLAQKHFFDRRIEAALQTSLLLRDYLEYLDTADVYQMIALAAANAGQFRICSRAMMKLEAYEGFSEAEREEMKNLSFQLFAKNPPYNPKEALGHCPSCDADMGKYESQCMTCGRKFPICVATGEPIFENKFWMCKRCHHHAHENLMTHAPFCPLCHDEITKK